MSFDGYFAAPDQSVDNPIGVAGCNLHAWAFALEAFRSRFGMDGGEVNARTAVIEESLVNIDAPIMGRDIFGGLPGG